MTAFDKSWALLKETIDMHEYPEGSGKFMSLEQMIHARNADARQNLNPPPYDAQTDPKNIMVNSKTGNYDPNDPEGWHPMGN
jgi:hypothetical protein|tara:strand:- start:2078 stop:2323 length:246 start_codon:yes stop_codon:yes gene_type:complete